MNYTIDQLIPRLEAWSEDIKREAEYAENPNVNVSAWWLDSAINYLRNQAAFEKSLNEAKEEIASLNNTITAREWESRGR